MDLNTYYVEATVVSTGENMYDTGLSAEQVEYLRGAERRGVISGLVVSRDVDLVAAFGGRS